MAYRRARQNGHTNVTTWLENWGIIPPPELANPADEDDPNALLDQGIDPFDQQRLPSLPVRVGIPREEWSRYNSLQLRQAVKRGDINSLKRMQGITLEDIRMRENSMLISAVSNEHIDVIQFLQRFGLTVEDAKARNNACLKIAVTNGNINVIFALKGCGLRYADVTVGNPSALDIANDDGNPAVLNALREWYDDENPSDLCEGISYQCGICQEPIFNIGPDRRVEGTSLLITPCKHVFHEDELRDWLTVKRTCPSDRTPIGDMLLQLVIPNGATFDAACAALQAELRR